MNKILALVSLVFLSITASAQNSGTIKGRLVDSIGKQSLKDATVTILEAKDSTLDVFGLAKADGSFSISNITFGEVIFQVNFAGYESINRRITFSKTNASVDLGSIYLQLASKDLGNVTVTQSVIQMKGDTVQFNASSFKTKPNAVAEDLLKKLPGMEVAKDGTIKSQGEQVQRVLVDGKRFFGDDPKLATQNLPPDVIDKIQVFDDLSDQSKFTGFDDGNRVKTINITTRKDKRKGYFGRLALGAGTDGNYNESVNINRFNGDQQITILGQGNNINKQSFSQQDNVGRGGGGGGGGRGGGGGGSSAGGITTTWAGGINYKDIWSPKIDAYGSYFYNNLNTRTEQNSLNQNILTSDSSTFTDARSSNIAKTGSHRFTFNIEDRIDSNNTFIFRPNITFQTSTPSTTSSSITTGGSKGVLVNQLSTKTSNSNSGYNVNGANLQLRHRFAKRFRTLSLDLGFSANENIGDGFNYSLNSFYKPFIKTDTVNLRSFDSSRGLSVNPTVSYTEPIGKNQVLEFRYSYLYSDNTSLNRTYSFDNAKQQYSTFDSLFSNSFKDNTISNTANLSYRLQNAKFNLSFGSGLQFTDRTSNNTTKGIVVAQNFVNITPSLNFTYNFTKTKNLRLFYNGRTGQPSTTQLQPIVTTSDKVNFQVGNPNLSQQFTNSLRVLYSSFDPFTQKVIFATINATAVSNDIQTSIIQQLNGGQTTTFVNLSGTYNLSGYFNYGFPLKKPKSNLNFQTNLNYAQNQNLLNLKSNYTYNTTIGQTVRWTTNLKKNFDVNLSVNATYNIARNSLQSSQNLNTYRYGGSAEFTYYTTNGWIFASEFEYTYNGNLSAGYNASVPLMSPSIAKQFLKNKAGELRLSCFDLLNQNVSVSRTVTANRITDTRTNTLTQYFLLTFTYNLRNFAGQQQRMPGMFGGARPEGMRMMGGTGGGNFRRDN